MEVRLSSPSLDVNDSIRNLSIDSVKILPRPGYGKAASFYIKLPYMLVKQYLMLKKHISQADIVLLVAPACTLPISYMLCRLLNKPLALYMVGDVLEVGKSGSSSFNISRLVIVAAAKWEWMIARNIARNHTTFTLGSSLHRKLLPVSDHIYPAMTSLVSEASVVTPVFTKLSDPIKIITVSRLSKEKGLHILLEAIANLTKDRRVVYTIIGEGTELASLEKLVSDLKLGGHVTFTGYLEQPEVRLQYLDADIFVLPSLSEGIPKVILDAMAAATPIVATRVGGIPDLLSEDQQRGWLVKPDSVEDVERALIECVKDDDERFNKLLNAYNYICDHTAEKESSKIEAKLLGIYNSITL